MITRTALKSAILSSRALRFLYCLYSTKIKSHRRLSFSQYGEDICLAHTLSAIENGFYVDVGAYHPRLGSNTHLLHRRGWSGINIDVNPLTKELFDIDRPRDDNVLAAVSDRPGTITVYGFGWTVGHNTVDPDTAWLWEKNFGTPASAYAVEARTLDDVIESSRFAGRDIDFLNIDVEGHELPVLRSLDFAKRRPKVICVEILAPTFEAAMASAPARLLREAGYQLNHWSGPSMIFTLDRGGVKDGVWRPPFSGGYDRKWF